MMEWIEVHNVGQRVVSVSDDIYKGMIGRVVSVLNNREYEVRIEGDTSRQARWFSFSELEPFPEED